MSFSHSRSASAKLHGRASVAALIVTVLAAAAIIGIGVGSPSVAAQPGLTAGGIGGSSTGGGGQPFSGPGVNCHFTELPVSDCNLIGITWFRIDDGGGAVPSATQVDQMLLHYGSTHILWLIGQDKKWADQVGEATLVYNRAIALGMTPPPFEFWNEYIQGFIYNGGTQSAAVANYLAGYAAFKAAMPSAAIVYAGADEHVFTDALYAAGLRPDRWSYHNYSWMPEGQTAGYDYLVAEYGVPVMDSEGTYFEFTRGAEYYLKMYGKMGTRPWCYYDGPQTDPRGLFSYVGYNSYGIAEWTPRTATYNAILAGLGGGTTGGVTGGSTGISGGSTGIGGGSTGIGGGTN